VKITARFDIDESEYDDMVGGILDLGGEILNEED